MTTVKNTAELRAALSAGTDPNSIEIAQAEQPDMAAIKSQSREEGATAERERITGIQALSSKGFEDEIAKAIDSGSSVEATGFQLFKAAQDRGITLNAIKSDGASASTTSPPGENGETERQAVVGAIVAGAKRR